MTTYIFVETSFITSSQTLLHGILSRELGNSLNFRSLAVQGCQQHNKVPEVYLLFFFILQVRLNISFSMQIISIDDDLFKNFHLVLRIFLSYNMCKELIEIRVIDCIVPMTFTACLVLNIAGRCTVHIKLCKKNCFLHIQTDCDITHIFHFTVVQHAVQSCYPWMIAPVSFMRSIFPSGYVLKTCYHVDLCSHGQLVQICIVSKEHYRYVQFQKNSTTTNYR